MQNDQENYIEYSYEVIKLQIKTFKVLLHAIYGIHKLIVFLRNFSRNQHFLISF